LEDAKISSQNPQVRYYRDRSHAMKRFLRRFRHEISTPLSGAALHLEVASRRVQREEIDRAAVLENLRVCQQAIENASQMLDWVGEFSQKEDDAPASHALAPIVARAAEPFREDLRARGLGLHLPEPREELRWFCSESEISELVSELTRNALQHASGPGSVLWSVLEGADPLLVCTSPGSLPEGDPEHLFGAAKGPESKGRGFGLLRARRLAQSNGADLTLFQNGETTEARVRFLPENA
jgi:signal transduction histidine kinase